MIPAIDAPTRPALKLGIVMRTELWYTGTVQTFGFTGRFAFLSAVNQAQYLIVGKAPRISGLTSRRTSEQRRQANTGRFVMFKKCTKCEQVKPISEFHKNPKTRDGYALSCKVCCADYQRQYRERNREELRRSKKEYRENNREQDLSRKRTYAANNRARESKRAVEWQKNNRAKVIIRSKLRRVKERSNGGELTPDQWYNLKKLYGYKCLACGKKKPLEPDHIIPVIKGGTGNLENIQPLCRSCNASKGTKVIDYRVRL